MPGIARLKTPGQMGLWASVIQLLMQLEVTKGLDFRTYSKLSYSRHFHTAFGDYTCLPDFG